MMLRGSLFAHISPTLEDLKEYRRRMAANQDGQLRVFEEAGFIRVAGRGDDDKVVDVIGEAVLSLLPDYRARSAMSAAGQRMIDGQGALRVARAIIWRIQDQALVCKEKG